MKKLQNIPEGRWRLYVLIGFSVLFVMMAGGIISANWQRKEIKDEVKSNRTVIENSSSEFDKKFDSVTKKYTR